MRTGARRTRIAAAAAIVACAAGCGSGHSSAFGPTSGGDDGGELLSEAGADGPAGSAETDDAGLALAASDGAGGGSATCQAGTYSGMYTGSADTSKVGGPTNFPISGPMAIALVRSGDNSGNGEDFDLVTNNATFDAVWGGVETADSAAGLVVIQSVLTGQLDCQNDSFSAMSTSADWTLLGIPAGTATVSFTGSYDAASSTIAGMFNITSALSVSTGTWSVTLAPSAPSGDP